MTGEAAVRIDKWLWRARFFKTRTLAAKAVAEGLRVNSRRISKPSMDVRPGDILTFRQAKSVRVIRIEALGERRGPAPEAAALYVDLDPPTEPMTPSAGPRPDKRARRDAIAGKTGQ